jgi:hypothetical protein
MLNQTELKKLRSRWMRWLGQLRSNSKEVELLDCNWSGWMNKVLNDHGIEKEKCKDLWKTAISIATKNELDSLDCIWIDMKNDR